MPALNQKYLYRNNNGDILDYRDWPISLFRDKELKDMIFLEELKDGMEVYIEEYPSFFGL